MENGHVNSGALTVAIALAAGLLSQTLASHLRIPGIVLLLAAGAILGPDVLHVIEPNDLGNALPALVGFAVAVILFEGGLNLNFRRLKRESVVIQRLITLGAFVTAVGGAAAAHFIMGWEWRLAFLFGTLVIVTGPTVITPLLRRIKVKRKLHVLLEAEGVLIDPVGAIVAVVALDLATHPGESMLSGMGDLVMRLGFGFALGAAAGVVIALLLKPRHLIPEGLENIFTLSLVLALFHLSNMWVPESGIGAVTIAGLIVGNIRNHALDELREFKEQLTILLIALLFVLLAADVRFTEVQDLGMPGILTVVVLMFLVRPLNVFLCTWRTDLKPRDKVFLSWIGPRGIVAAAVASFFASELSHAGLPGGSELRAMVFLVISITVFVQGLSGGWVAALLGVRLPKSSGYAILGANELALALAQVLRDAGKDVILFDTSADRVRAAEKLELPIVYGNALEERTLLRAGIESYEGAIGLTPNEEVNLLFARNAKDDFKVSRTYVALHRTLGMVTDKMIAENGSHVLFGSPLDLDLWSVRLRRGTGTVEKWRFAPVAAGDTAKGSEENAKPADRQKADDAASPNGAARELTVGEANANRKPSEPASPFVRRNLFVALTLTHGSRTRPVDESSRPKDGDLAHFVVFGDKRDEAEAQMRASGWLPASD